MAVLGLPVLSFGWLVAGCVSFAALAPAPAAVAPAAQVAAPAAGLSAVPAAAHRTIVTAAPLAQAAFDRGLALLYAFNIGAARAAFRAAEAADPHAVLPYFGEAVAETIDINMPTTADGERRGADAVRRGLAATSGAPADDERALLAAAALRFDLSKSQDARFAAYYAALRGYVLGHPADGTGLTLAAYAGWNATGRLTSGAADELTADARPIADDLDRALALDFSDLGARHLRIHFWEQAHRPDRALADADYLAALAYLPGQSHLQHMAGHIYDRLGDYAGMARVNAAACANDEAYFRQGDGDGQRYMRRYHEHDVDFVLYGLTTIGRNAEARAFAARETEFEREAVALRLHDDRAVLGLLGAAITPMRVIAEARSGNLEDARKDLRALAPGAGDGTADADVDIATAAVARAGNDFPAAIAAYRHAAALTGGELGDPKNRWWTPVGEGLAAALLEARQPAAAEQAFATELGRYPNDPHLEFGLAQALAAQGKDDRGVRAAYRTHWQGEKPLTAADLG